MTLFLHDFAFKSPEEVAAEIRQVHGSGGHGELAERDGHSMAPAADTEGMDHAAVGHATMNYDAMSDGQGAMGGMMQGMMPMGDIARMEMDSNDYNWAAYLANDRTLADPEVVRVERAAVSGWASSTSQPRPCSGSKPARRQPG